MYQSSFDETLQLPTAARLLHPNIKRALGVLDARLEEELKRYRRYRTGQVLEPSAVHAGQKLSYREMQAFGVVPLSVAMPLSQSPVAPVASDAQGSDAAAPANALALVSQAGNRPEPHDLSPLLAEGAIPDDYLASSEQLLHSLAEEDDDPDLSASQARPLLTPLSVGSMLLMLLGSGMFGYLIMNPGSLQLAVDWSESVLVGIARHYQAYVAALAARADRISARSKTDPPEESRTWLSSAPALDRQEFLNLSLNNFSALQTRPSGNLSLFPQTAPSPISNATSAASSLQQLAPSPSPLASLAPTPLASPSPLSIAASASPASTAAPSDLPPLWRPARSQPRSQPRPTSSSSPSQGNSAASPRPAAFQPTPTPSPTQSYELPQNPAPAAAPSPPPSILPSLPTELPTELPTVPPPAPTPTPQGDYSVVTPYTNDRALESAQQASPDASFRNLDDGAYIKFGDSYSNRSEAEAKAQELQRQGLNVEIKESK
jgi:hypothetical protein